MILLSKESYQSGSEDTVMKCVVSSEQKPIPEPDYYIITEYLGDHYELISYKEKKIFSNMCILTNNFRRQEKLYALKLF